MISVLFVDDNTDFLVQFRPFLEKTGEVQLDVVQSAKLAIEKLKSRRFDVIVCYEKVSAVNGIEFVSDMDGIGFLLYLRSMGNPTPVILFNRMSENRVAFEEVNNGTEIVIPRYCRSAFPGSRPCHADQADGAAQEVGARDQTPERAADRDPLGNAAWDLPDAERHGRMGKPPAFRTFRHV